MGADAILIGAKRSSLSLIRDFQKSINHLTFDPLDRLLLLFLRSARFPANVSRTAGKSTRNRELITKTTAALLNWSTKGPSLRRRLLMRCNTNNNRATSPIASHRIQHAICCVCVPNPKSVFKERPDIRCVTHNFFCFHIFLLVLNHDDNVRLLAALLLLLLLLLLSSWADVLPCRHHHWVDGREILVLFLTTHKNDTNDNYCDSIEPFIESLSVSLSTHPTSHLLCPMVLCPQFLNGPLFLVSLEWEKEFRETVALLFDSSSSCSILTLPYLFLLNVINHWHPPTFMQITSSSRYDEDKTDGQK